MPVDKATVARIAHLARLSVSEDHLESVAGDLNKILGWIDQLSQVPTDDVAPMTSVVHMHLPEREDTVTEGGNRDAVLANAPVSEHGFYAVPKVIE